MNIKLIRISPRDEFGMVLVKLSVNVGRGKAWDGGNLGIFVPASDSISEVRTAALKSLRKFAEDILGFPGNDSTTDDHDHISETDFPQVTFDMKAPDLTDSKD